MTGTEAQVSTYLPGPQVALIGPEVVLLAPARHGRVLADLVAPVAAGRSLSALEVVGLLAGGDLAAVPDFAFARLEGDGFRVVVRGGYDVTVGAETISGQEAMPWTDRFVDGADAVSSLDLSTRDAVGAGAVDRTAYPVACGLVPAAEVCWRPTRTSSSGGPAVAAPAPAASRPTDPDHDGLTVMAADIRRSQGGSSSPTAPPTPRPVVGPPPAAAPVAAPVAAAAPAAVPAPPAPPVPPAPVRPQARIAVTGHPEVTVRSKVLIGRSPRAGQTSSAQLPTLIVLDDPYVSGTHLEIAFRDDVLVAVDRSTNGTLLTLPGRPTERMTKNSPTALADGARLVLAEGVIATVMIGRAGG